jgi:hypothetical protein
MAESNAARAPKPRTSARIVEIAGRLIERALRNRVRYRYVRPRVLRDDLGWRVVSPCCSRNVDSAGGVIDIALLQPSGPVGWRLYSRDHAGGAWVPRDESDRIQDLLDAICLDPERVFWP